MATLTAMERLFDLPAHPLLVHFPVVAIPVVALLGIWIALSPSARKQYGVVVLIAAVITFIATFLAVESGKALADAFQLGDENIGTHKSLGELLRVFVFVLTICIAGVVFLGDRTYEKRQAAVDAQADAGSETETASAPPSTALTTVMRVGAVVFGLLSIVWVIRTGHSGAESVWDGQLPDDEAAAAVIVDPAELDTAEPDADEATATTIEETTTTSSTTTPSTTVVETTVTEATPVAAIDPERIYAANCSRCHGVDGIGTRGPNLTNFAEHFPTPEPAIAIITNGQSGMPQFGSSLSAEEIAALVDYLPTAFIDS